MDHSDSFIHRLGGSMDKNNDINHDDINHSHQSCDGMIILETEAALSEGSNDSENCWLKKLY